jgi:hypothetical protein
MLRGRATARGGGASAVAGGGVPATGG